jgi:hypothetical protein
MHADVKNEGILGRKNTAPVAGGGIVDTPQPTGKEEKTRISKVVLESLKDAALTFHPKTIIAKFKEAFATYSGAKSTKDEEIVGKKEVITAKVLMKLSAAIAVSEVVGPYIGAPLFGMWFQEATKNAYMGVLGTIVGDYLPAVISFEIAWLGLNTAYYANSVKSLLGTIKAFYKDVLPLHAACIVASIPAYSLGAALNSALIAGLNHIKPHLAENIHVFPLLTEMTNGAIAQTLFLVLLSGMLVRVAGKIAPRYGAYLEKTFGNSGGNPQ